MLHRVVMKRSGRRPSTGAASGFTAADHLIYTMIEQARNFGRLNRHRAVAALGDRGSHTFFHLSTGIAKRSSEES